MRYRFAALAALCALAATPAAASTATAEANLADANGDLGAELAVGVPVLEDGGFSLIPGAGVFFHHRDHPGYNDNSYGCYRSSDGAQVAQDKCDNSGTKVFARIEGIYRLPVSFAFGVGARFIGGDLRAYATGSMPILPHFDVKANVGAHYLAAGVQARF